MLTTVTKEKIVFVEHMQLNSKPVGSFPAKNAELGTIPLNPAQNAGGGKSTSKNVDITIPNTCLLCGAETSSGHHVCHNCYFKLKDETIIRILNRKTCEILDNQYLNKKITCEDGHVVISKDEARIDDYLYKEGIRHRYEVEYLPNNDNLKPIHPDWILPDYIDKGTKESKGDVYIEFFGVEHNEEYNRQKEYKMKVYREDKVTLICMYPDDMIDLSKNLARKLKRCKIGEIN